MLVPNPMEELEQEGFVYLWNFYCMKPGKLFVHVSHCVVQYASGYPLHRENRENRENGKTKFYQGNFAKTQGKHREFGLLKL